MKTWTFVVSILMGVALPAHAQLTTRAGVRILQPQDADADAPAPSAPIPPQSELLQCLSAGTFSARAVCIDQIRYIPAADRDPAILAFALNEGARMQHELELGRVAARSNTAVDGEGSDYSEYRFRITVLLAESRDPRAIPLLLALSNGRVTDDALVEFGEQAFPAVIAEAETGHDPGTAMMILEGMFHRKIPLTAPSRARIVALARERLTTGKREPHILYVAIRLAGATRDSTLRGILKRLAASPRAVQELGVMDTEDIDRLQRTAANELAEP